MSGYARVHLMAGGEVPCSYWSDGAKAGTYWYVHNGRFVLVRKATVASRACGQRTVPVGSWMEVCP
jgi:hypothetical protein